MIKFSIVIPAYNVEKYLLKCVDSCLRQTYTNFELLIVDDGSTDRTPQLCEELGEYDNRIKIFHQENSGQSVARNFAVDRATGDYIMFLDSDDFWIDEFVLEKIVRHIAIDVDVVAFDIKKYFEDSNTYDASMDTFSGVGEEYISGQDFLRDVLSHRDKYEWFPCKYAFKTEVWRSFARFPTGVLYEDTATVFKPFLFSGKVIVIKEPLYVYRVNRIGSSTNSVDIKSLKERINAARISIEYICKLDLESSLKDLLCNNQSLGFYEALIRSNDLNKNQKQLMYDEFKNNMFLCNYTTSKRQRFVFYLLKILGVKNVTFLLDIRRKIR